MIEYPYSKHQFDENEIDAVVDVLRNGWISRGPRVSQFEINFSSLLGYAHSVACTNGSAALEIILRSAGIGQGDEVIVPTLSWASTATSVSMVGAEPKFADIDISNYCVSYTSISELISNRTKAIIVVHFAGIAADMDKIWEIAESNGLLVIEDCAHALGGSYQNSKPIGSSCRSYAGAFSLHPAKNITTAEGGMIVTNDSERAKNLKLYRSGGVRRHEESSLSKAKYDIPVISSNYHTTDIQAAIGMVQLTKLTSFINTRRNQVTQYNKNLGNIEGLNLHSHPETSAANLYIPLLPVHVDRDNLFSTLNSIGIGAYYHYPLIHKSSVYNKINMFYKYAEEYSQRALTLPLGPHLKIGDIDRISEQLVRILKPFKD